MTTDRNQLILINGPNLNLLGSPEPALGGTVTLADVEKLAIATAAGFRLEMRVDRCNPRIPTRGLITTAVCLPLAPRLA
jgi:3-dehydroquinate dehydratase